MSLHTRTDPISAARQSQLVIGLATSALRAGDLADAQRLLREQLIKNPRDTAALVKLAEIAVDQMRVEEATLLLRRAADSEPTADHFLTLLRHLQIHVGALAVLGEIERTPRELRNLFEVRVMESIALNALGEYDRHIAILRDLAQAAPGHAGVRLTLGEALSTIGRREEAVAAVRDAIRCRPTCGEAYWALANFKAFRFSDADVSSMRKALRKDLGIADAVPLHFALGKALEERGLYQQSFRHYDTGNRLHATGLDRSNMFATVFVDGKIATLTTDFFERRAGSGCPDGSPIFVVGLHRSGSTLVEQILASHPAIEGTTEMKVVQEMWNRMWRTGMTNRRNAFQELASLDRHTLRKLGDEYLHRARSFRRTDRPFFIDKLPANWMHLGLIRLALPNAKIIDARRHPMACGFSNFKQHYRNDNPFASSQESIGAFYHDYWRFMRHFDVIQPGAVHRVINERLIEDPEGEIGRMLDFIGVPFDPACLDFHKNKRAVGTPSAEQVRRPLNRDGVDQWRHYEQWLGPLKTALGPALEQWDQ